MQLVCLFLAPPKFTVHTVMHICMHFVKTMLLDLWGIQSRKWEIYFFASLVYLYLDLRCNFFYFNAFFNDDHFTILQVIMQFFGRILDTVSSVSNLFSNPYRVKDVQLSEYNGKVLLKQEGRLVLYKNQQSQSWDCLLLCPESSSVGLRWGLSPSFTNRSRIKSRFNPDSFENGVYGPYLAMDWRTICIYTTCQKFWDTYSLAPHVFILSTF